jgi:hypothetical protein
LFAEAELLELLDTTDDLTELATLELATLLDATEQLRTNSQA